MTTKIKWRLSKLPTPSEIAELVKDKIITQEEAHQVLFDQVTEEDVDVEALKAEIKFLRQVVEDLSKSRSDKVTVIEKHIKQYPDWTWNQPYYNYCGTGLVDTTSNGTVNLCNITDVSGILETNTSLTDLKTF